MRTILIMYALLIPCFVLYMRAKYSTTQKSRYSIVWKGLCTTIIAVAGITGFLNATGDARVYAALIVAGLLCGLAGDIAIGYHFVAGMLFFGVGHCFYMVAIARVAVYAPWAVPVFVVLYVLALVLFKKSGVSPGKYTIPGILYGAVILGMLSLAIMMPLSIMPSGAVLLAGAVLFVISDTMLAWLSFGGGASRKLPDIVCLGCYFGGQSLFAISTMLVK